MTLDLEALLAPVSDADRVGPDLAYDPQRHAIEQAFDSQVSIDSTGTPPTDSDTDWRKIVVAIVEQSDKAKDVWLAVYLCRAGARMGKLDVVEAGAHYLCGLIERYWEDVHPRLEEYGIEGRTGACDTLASYPAFIGPLRNVVLVQHPRHGSFTGEDLLRFQRSGDAESGFGELRGALEDPSGLEQLAIASATIERIEAVFRTVDAALAERAGVGAGASFAPIYQALGEIGGAARAFLPQSMDADETPDDPSTEFEVPASMGAVGGPLRSRADVTRAIDLVIAYYRQREPQSPVPLLLGRAREWVDRDFLEVLEDIAPNAMGDARQLLMFRGGD
jgi:type VI secretion system protein ImpA